MNELSESVRERALKSLPGGITRTTVYVPPHPPYIGSGTGCRLTDIEGHVVIDANNNYTSLIHGHAHPKIVQAACAAISAGSAFGLPTPSEVDMAETLSTRTKIPHWRFCNSGTEAVMMALRCARAYTGRELIIRFAGSYHGTCDYVVDAASAGVSKGASNSMLVLPQGDLEALRAAFRDYGTEIAAVIIDLMPNRAGLKPATEEFAQEVRKLTSSNGSLMIVDEVITFRVAFGGLSSLYDFIPDIITVGKIIGGGFPAGAVGGAEEYLKPFNPHGNSVVSWGGTFSANPVTMRAGKIALDLFNKVAVQKLNDASDFLRNRLRKAGIEPFGRGSLLRVDLGEGNRKWWDYYNRGLLVCSNGLVALSTAMTETDIDKIGDIILSIESTK